MACPHPQGTLWQCETCYAIHEAADARKGQWHQIADPRREHRIADAVRQEPVKTEPTTPTVTESVVQLVIGTYMAHMVVVPNDVGAEPLGMCAECEAGIYGRHTIQAHAQGMAAAALQDALAAGEPR